MALLFIDTSTENCSAVVWSASGTFARQSDLAQSHAKQLLSFIDSLLQEAKIERHALTAIVVTNGPGSFTGIRIGLSSVQGLAFGLACPVITVPSLMCLAASALARSEGKIILPALDARMSELYWAGYQFKANQLIQVAAPQVTAQASFYQTLAEQFDEEPASLIGLGSGWQVMQSTASGREYTSLTVSFSDNAKLFAGDILALFRYLNLLTREGVNLERLDELNHLGLHCYHRPDQIQALYLRNEVAWEKRVRIRQTSLN